MFGRLAMSNLTNVSRQNGHVIKSSWRIPYIEIKLLLFSKYNSNQYLIIYLQTRKTDGVGALQKFRFPIDFVVFAQTNAASHEILDFVRRRHFPAVDCLHVINHSNIYTQTSKWQTLKKFFLSAGCLTQLFKYVII